MREKNETKTMHLFAGIGGGLLSDLILGHTPVIAVEWEPYACKVLRERAADGWFPSLSVWEGDVRLFDPSEYAGVVDIIHAGFPCQDISVAGKQAGVSEGTRSGLYREVLRIAGVVRPKQLFLENVSAILSNGLGTVLGDLAALGYDTRWLCIRASDVGAPHHRDRWFALANAKSDGDQRDGGELPRTDEQKAPERQEERLRQPIDASERRIPTNVADSRHTGICQRGEPIDAVQDVRQQGRVFSDGLSSICQKEGDLLADSKRIRCNKVEQSNITGTITKKTASETKYSSITNGRSWWAVESQLGRVVDGIPYRVGQLKGYGNAQVPLQAAAAYRLLGGM